MSPRVVVVGGGISGLSTAWFLAARGVRATVLEAEARLGGNVRTLRRRGFVVDEGPDSWVATKPQVSDLARAVGLGDHLVETIAENRKVYVRVDQGLVPLPEGLALGIPTRLLPLATTKLLSIRGKLRAALDLVLPRGFGRAPGEDEALGAFIERRLGREVLDNLVGPLLGGLYTGDVSRLSLLGTFPQLAELEARGGLIRGSLAAAKRARPSNGAKPSAFVSLRGGVGALVERLAEKLGGSVVRGARVTRLSRSGAEWIVEGAHGTTRADEIVLCGPAWLAASLLAPIREGLANELAEIPYASSATVFLGYHRNEVRHPLDASGYLVPKKVPGGALASTWVTSKWSDRAPEGEVLLRVFFGGGDVDRRDDELVSFARDEVQRALAVDAEPSFVHVARFRRASPQPVVGHPARVRRIREAAQSIGGLHLVGSAYDGVGLGDCVRQAEAVAGRIASMR